MVLRRRTGGEPEEEPRRRHGVPEEERVDGLPGPLERSRRPGRGNRPVAEGGKGGKRGEREDKGAHERGEHFPGKWEGGDPSAYRFFEGEEPGEDEEAEDPARDDVDGIVDAEEDA